MHESIKTCIKKEETYDRYHEPGTSVVSQLTYRDENLRSDEREQPLGLWHPFACMHRLKGDRFSRRDVENRGCPFLSAAFTLRSRMRPITLSRWLVNNKTPNSCPISTLPRAVQRPPHTPFGRQPRPCQDMHLPMSIDSWPCSDVLGKLQQKLSGVDTTHTHTHRPIIDSTKIHHG